MVTGSLDDGSASGISAQRYNDAGNAIGGEFQVNTYTERWQTGSSVAALGDVVSRDSHRCEERLDRLWCCLDWLFRRFPDPPTFALSATISQHTPSCFFRRHVMKLLRGSDIIDILLMRR